MDFGPQKLRGEATSGEVVTPIKINKDGTLQVRLDLFCYFMMIYFDVFYLFPALILLYCFQVDLFHSFPI